MTYFCFLYSEAAELRAFRFIYKFSEPILNYQIKKNQSSSCFHAPLNYYVETMTSKILQEINLIS